MMFRFFRVWIGWWCICRGISADAVYAAFDAMPEPCLDITVMEIKQSVADRYVCNGWPGHVIYKGRVH